ncbi:hypothetical protein [Tenacibaculum sp. 190524A05c]|uniref:hypothetical protein n=1 Tax=Tenacibaculum platacis TaxID=3137852 RepID=UPI0031FB4558
MLTTPTQVKFPLTPFIVRYMQKDWSEVESIDDVVAFCDKWKEDMNTSNNLVRKEAIRNILMQVESNFKTPKAS